MVLAKSEPPSRCSDGASPPTYWRSVSIWSLGHVELVAALVRDEQVVALDAADRPLDHALVLADAVLVVHDVVAGLEVLERAGAVGALARAGGAVGAATAGEVALGDDRHLRVRQRAAAVQRRDDDRPPARRGRRASVDRTGKSRPLSEQQLAEPGGRAGAVGGDDHAEAAADQLGQPVGEAGAVAGDRAPAGRLDERGVGRLGRRVDRPERFVPDSSVSGSAWRRGNDRSGSRAHVDARVRARSSSSAIRSRARSRIRRGSTSRSLAVGGSTSVSEPAPSSTSHGSQLSMPSKCTPSDRRSHCSRPHGSLATSFGGPLAHVVGRHQLAGREDAHLVEVVDRALVVDAERGEPVDLVAPQVDADRGVGGRREDVDDRTAAGELAAVLDEFLAPVAELDERRPSTSGSISAPGRTMIGSMVVAPGPSFCSSARTPVTITPGHRSGSRSRHSTSRRWPIVSTLGLTRSNGSVSQPGNCTTSSAGRNWARSSASWPAIVPVGQVTTSGRLDDSVASAAIEIGRATSTTARRALGLAEGAGQPRLVTQERRERAERSAGFRHAVPREYPLTPAPIRNCARWLLERAEVRTFGGSDRHVIACH